MEAMAKAASDLIEAEKANLIDDGPIREQIRSAADINKAVQAKAEYKAKAAELQSLRRGSNSLTEKLKSIDQEKARLLENAKWPLPGMSIDEDGVLMDGVPFEQASKAQRVIASVKILMAMNPKLRLMICQDGNDLDNETLAALEKTLEDNDYQMVLEFVTRSVEDEERCAVVFRDGVGS